MRVAGQRVGATVTAVLALALVAGCSSTPEHTNTLIFGTTTKVAIDVSQDPTGTVGVTIGYRRQEAVWMPLLPNQGGKDARVPATCNGTECPKYTGNEGSDRDTYSVFASFGGEASGSAGGSTPGAQAGAKIVQYFATGLAARALANRGGAALVNTNADPLANTITPEQRDRVLRQVRVEQSQASAFAAKVSTDGRVDAAKLDTALDAAKIKDTGSGKTLQSFAGRPTADLAQHLQRHADAYPMDKLAGGAQ